MLETVKNYMASYLPFETLNIVKIHLNKENMNRVLKNQTTHDIDTLNNQDSIGFGGYLSSQSALKDGKAVGTTVSLDILNLK